MAGAPVLPLSGKDRSFRVTTQHLESDFNPDHCVAAGGLKFNLGGARVPLVEDLPHYLYPHTQPAGTKECPSSIGLVWDSKEDPHPQQSGSTSFLHPLQRNHSGVPRLGPRDVTVSTIPKISLFGAL